MSDSAVLDGAVDSTLPADDARPIDTGRPDGRVVHVDKLDLLLAIDNSPSMGDKQDNFARVVPQLVRTLLASGAVKDLHIGVVTSSLGSFGTSACDPSFGHNDDRGHLLPRADAAVASG